MHSYTYLYHPRASSPPPPKCYLPPYGFYPCGCTAHLLSTRGLHVTLLPWVSFMQTHGHLILLDFSNLYLSFNNIVIVLGSRVTTLERDPTIVVIIPLSLSSSLISQVLWDSLIATLDFYHEPQPSALMASFLLDFYLRGLVDVTGLSI